MGGTVKRFPVEQERLVREEGEEETVNNGPYGTINGLFRNLANGVGSDGEGA
jgi:hypothetical protein